MDDRPRSRLRAELLVAGTARAIRGQRAGLERRELVCEVEQLVRLFCRPHGPPELRGTSPWRQCPNAPRVESPRGLQRAIRRRVGPLVGFRSPRVHPFEDPRYSRSLSARRHRTRRRARRLGARDCGQPQRLLLELPASRAGQGLASPPCQRRGALCRRGSRRSGCCGCYCTPPALPVQVGCQLGPRQNECVTVVV